MAEWAAGVLAALGEGNAPDVLINNAGINGDGAAGLPLWEVPKEVWDGVIDVNVHGVLNVMRHFVPAMVGGRFQHLIGSFPLFFCVFPAFLCFSVWGLSSK